MALIALIFVTASDTSLEDKENAAVSVPLILIFAVAAPVVSTDESLAKVLASAVTPVAPATALIRLVIVLTESLALISMVREFEPALIVMSWA